MDGRNEMDTDTWVVIILSAVSALGALFWYTVREIRNEVKDKSRWMRHELRTVYCELIELAKSIPHKDADDVHESARKKISGWDNE